MQSLSIVEREVLINDLMKYALDEQMEEKEYICPYYNTAYATSQTRTNHWNKSKTCRLYHRIQRVEVLLQNLICLGCGVTYETFYNCKRHMKECNRVDKASIPKKQIIYDEKVLDQWNYGEMKFQKKLLDPKLSKIQLPEFIYELKNGYISAKWISYFKQQFSNGLPIKLRSDVRNDFLWNNLKITMLKLIGSLFKIQSKIIPGKSKGNSLINTYQLRVQDKFHQIRFKQKTSYSIGPSSTLRRMEFKSQKRKVIKCLRHLNGLNSKIREIQQIVKVNNILRSNVQLVSKAVCMQAQLIEFQMRQIREKRALRETIRILGYYQWVIWRRVQVRNFHKKTFKQNAYSPYLE